MSIRTVAAIAALLVLSQPAFGKESDRLLPTSPWNLRYDDQACRLLRQFGTGDGSVVAIFEKYAPGPDLQIILTGNQIRPKRGTSFRYRFVPSEEYDTAENVLYGDHPTKGTSWQFSSGLTPWSERKSYKDWRVPNDFAARYAREREQAARIEALEVKSGMERSVVLATGKLDKPFAALDTCLDNLVESWGFDPILQKGLTARPHPKSDPSGWIGPGDYPSEMLRNSVSGGVRLRLDIDPVGKPTKCVVQGKASDPKFEKTSCDLLMRKARFEPAKNAEGNPVTSYWATSVVFVTSS